MRKSYVITTEGKIIGSKNVSYAITANNKEEAIKIAEQHFLAKYPTIDNQVNLTDIHERNIKWVIASIVMMSIAIFLSYISWKNGHETISIAPDLISCFYSAILFFVYILRIKTLKNSFKSIWDIIYYFLLVLLFASFIKALLVQKNIAFLGLLNIEINSNKVLIIGILMSIFGVKIVSVFCYLIIVFFAVSNLLLLNDAMGSIWGPLYLVCATGGFLTYLANDSELNEFVPEVKSSMTFVGNSVMQDFIGAKKEVSKISKTIKDKDNSIVNLIEK